MFFDNQAGNVSGVKCWNIWNPTCARGQCIKEAREEWQHQRHSNNQCISSSPWGVLMIRLELGGSQPETWVVSVFSLSFRSRFARRFSTSDNVKRPWKCSNPTTKLGLCSLYTTGHHQRITPQSSSTFPFFSRVCLFLLLFKQLLAFKCAAAGPPRGPPVCRQQFLCFYLWVLCVYFICSLQGVSVCL